MTTECGIFTISLDFELYWGVRDKRSIEQYRQNLQGGKEAVSEILQVFSDNGIHATWATVGFLFFEDVTHLRKNCPEILPKYEKKRLSPYRYIERTSQLNEEYHFAPELIEFIKQQNGQEIGTHTFSHYYCLAAGQSRAEFVEDISSAIDIAHRKGISVKSLVFPRNQCDPEYLPVLAELGIRCYRGTEANWMYKLSGKAEQSKVKRAIRLLDAYINLSGHHTYNLKNCKKEKPFNFPSSRFLRPYSKKLSALERLRLKRITNAMDDAAVNNRLFHLWWHPHNFGVNVDKNITFLKKIVKHYGALNRAYGMRSLNMGELVEIQERHGGVRGITRRG